MTLLNPIHLKLPKGWFDLSCYIKVIELFKFWKNTSLLVMNLYTDQSHVNVNIWLQNKN